jgi:hypothetical protein
MNFDMSIATRYPAVWTRTNLGSPISVAPGLHNVKIRVHEFSSIFERFLKLTRHSKIEGSV